MKVTVSVEGISNLARVRMQPLVRSILERRRQATQGPRRLSATTWKSLLSLDDVQAEPAWPGEEENL
ncbi:MAG: hypothetical protein AB7E80_10040 [Hyphomicrobiaceae bacterium]